MRSIIPGLLSLILLWACATKSNEQNSEDYGSTESSAEKVSVPDDLIGQGAALIKKSDCNTCHHISSQIVGPSHTDVAKKYEFTEENIKLIAERIIKGSSGVWGPVMMNPHPNLSQADAEKMARYVLSLDGENEPE